MGNFLEQFNDTGIAVNMAWTPNDEVIKQFQRCSAWAAMATFAEQVPRRLPDANALDLANDKRMSRKVANRCGTFMAQWQADGDFDDIQQYGHNAKEAEELKAQGAQVQWQTWWADSKTHLQQELRRIATHALRTGHIKSGNRFCNRIINELAQLEQIIANS